MCANFIQPLVYLAKLSWSTVVYMVALQYGRKHTTYITCEGDAGQ